jgi:hypothetical protein
MIVCPLCGSERLEFVARFTYRFSDGLNEVMTYSSCNDCKAIFGVSPKGYSRVPEHIQDLELKILGGLG